MMALQLPETSNTAVAMREMDEAKIRRLATVVRDSNDAIIISDFEGRITAWNHGAELIYGYSEEDALQMNLWQITPSNRAAEKKEFIRRLKEGEAITSFETQRETKDGRIIDIWMTVTKMLDNAGKPIGIASTERDITGRKKKENEFKSAKSLLDSVIDSSPFAMWISDRGGMLIRTNRALRETLNLTDEQLIGKYNVLNDANLEIQGVMPMVRAVFEMYTPARFIIPWKASNAGAVDFKSGRDLYIDVSIFPILDNNGELNNAVCQWVNITERKKAEEELRVSSLYARSLIEASLDPLVTINPDGKITDVNDAAVQSTGASRDKLIGTDFSSYFTEPDKAREGYLQVFAKGSVTDYPLTIRHKDGKLADVLYNASVYKDINGKVLGVFAAARDITERRKKEAELAVAQQLYKELFENVGVGILRSTPGPKGVFIDVNPAMVRMFEADCREQLMALHPSEIYWDESQRKVVSDAIEANGFIDEEVKYKTLKGKQVWCRIHSIKKIDTDGRIFFDNTIEDITKRKRAEEALIASEGRYRRLFESAKDGILILDAETGMIVDVNPFLIQILGYSREQFIGKAVWELGFLKDIIANRENFLELQQKEYIRYEDLPLETADRRSISVEFVSNVYLVDKKKVVQCNIRDITDRRWAEDKIKQLNNELLKKNTELEQLIYIASHDLRSPLVNVQGFSKELGLLVNELAEIASHAGLPEKQQYRLADIVSKEFPEAHNYILASVSKMDVLLKGLLRLSRLGRTAISLQKIDMDEMLSTVLKTLEFQIQKSKASIDIAALPSCIGDPDQVNQVFTNLIDNAVKYLSPDRLGVIRITGKSQNGFSEYCVEDNGIGIAPEHQSQAFEIYHRLNPQMCEGEGLGLAIVKKVVDRINGNIRLESELGKGSRFIVSLPGA